MYATLTTINIFLSSLRSSVESRVRVSLRWTILNVLHLLPYSQSVCTQ